MSNTHAHIIVLLGFYTKFFFMLFFFKVKVAEKIKTFLSVQAL